MQHILGRGAAFSVSFWFDSIEWDILCGVFLISSPKVFSEKKYGMTAACKVNKNSGVGSE